MAYKFSDILNSELTTQKLCRLLCQPIFLKNDSNLSNEPAAFNNYLAIQRELQRRAAGKLPRWVQHGCILTRKSLEQATPESVARWKSTLVSGGLMLDLSGGLGVDAAFFSDRFSRVISIDPDEELAAIFKVNCRQLGIENVLRFISDAHTALLQNTKSVDCIYIDPDRRPDSSGQRVTGLSAYSPAPDQIYQKFSAMAPVWLIKLSPLDDLQLIMKTFTDLSRVFVVSLKSEVKEILLELKPGYSGTLRILTVEIENQNDIQVLDYVYEAIDRLEPSKVALRYLLEPSAGVIKSGYLKHKGIEQGLFPLNQSCTLWTSDTCAAAVPGRWIHIEKAARGSSFNRFIKQVKEAGVRESTLKVRDFPGKSEELQKLSGLTISNEHRVYLSRVHGENRFYSGRVVTPERD
jgi:hypothetical protein